MLATAHYGLPVSTTHVISSSVMGVGATRRLSAVRWGVAGNIVIAWILTIPAAGTGRGARLVHPAADPRLSAKRTVSPGRSCAAASKALSVSTASTG